MPICFRDREAGESKMSLPIAFEALMLVPRLRALRPQRLRPPGAEAGAPPRWPRRRRGVLAAAAESAGDSGEPDDPARDGEPERQRRPDHAERQR